jgi:hypothetical protein
MLADRLAAPNANALSFSAQSRVTPSACLVAVNPSASEEKAAHGNQR